MGFPWKKIGSFGQKAADIVGLFIPAVKQVEDIAVLLTTQHTTLTGPQKQALALGLINASISASEQLSGKDLVNDAAVQDAAKKVIDAIVAFQHVVDASAGEFVEGNGGGFGGAF